MNLDRKFMPHTKNCDMLHNMLYIVLLIFVSSILRRFFSSKHRSFIGFASFASGFPPSQAIDASQEKLRLREQRVTEREADLVAREKRVADREATASGGCRVKEGTKYKSTRAPIRGPYKLGRGKRDMIYYILRLYIIFYYVYRERMKFER